MNRELLIDFIAFVILWTMFRYFTHSTPFEATFGTIVTLKLGTIRELLENHKQCCLCDKKYGI